LPERSITPRLVTALHSGEIDVAFVRPPVSENEAEGLGIELIVDEPMLVVLPRAHRLARKRSVPLGALAGETFILWPRAFGPGLYDRIIAAFQRAGFTPELEGGAHRRFDGPHGRSRFRRDPCAAIVSTNSGQRYRLFADRGGRTELPHQSCVSS